VFQEIAKKQEFPVGDLPPLAFPESAMRIPIHRDMPKLESGNVTLLVH
jgi:hypothetical protein